MLTRFARWYLHYISKRFQQSNRSSCSVNQQRTARQTTRSASCEVPTDWGTRGRRPVVPRETESPTGPFDCQVFRPWRRCAPPTGSAAMKADLRLLLSHLTLPGLVAVVSPTGVSAARNRLLPRPQEAHW